MYCVLPLCVSFSCSLLTPVISAECLGSELTLPLFSFCTSSLYLFALQQASRTFICKLLALLKLPNLELKSPSKVCILYNKSSWECATLTPNNKIQQVLIFFWLSSWLWNWETLRKGKYCLCLKKRKCNLKKPTILSTN